MAVVKSPKNVKRKQLWLKKDAALISNTSSNYSSNTNKLFKFKTKKWFNTKSKSSVLKNVVTLYGII